MAWIRLFGFQAKKISIMVYLIRSKNPCPDGIITVQAKLIGATMTLIFWLDLFVFSTIVFYFAVKVRSKIHQRIRNAPKWSSGAKFAPRHFCIKKYVIIHIECS